MNSLPAPHGNSEPKEQEATFTYSHPAWQENIVLGNKPDDEVSMGKAMDELNKMQHIYDLLKQKKPRGIQPGASVCILYVPRTV
jgi:hypothetical protein